MFIYTLTLSRDELVALDFALATVLHTADAHNPGTYAYLLDVKVRVELLLSPLPPDTDPRRV